MTHQWGYGRGRFVCSMLTLEKCHMWGGTRLMDHMCWTTDRQVCRAGLRAGRFVEQDYERGGL